MKNVVKTLVLLVCVISCQQCISQTNTVKQNVYRNQSTPQQQTVRRAEMPGIVPRPAKINFLSYRKQFVNSPHKAVNVFERAASGNQMIASQVNNQLPAGSRSTMDYKPGNAGRNNSASYRSSSYHNAANLETMVLPSITKRATDGSSVSYFIKSPAQTADWENGAAYNAKVMGQTPPAYNKDNKMNCHTTTLIFNARSTSFMNAQPEIQGMNLIPGIIYDFSDLSKGNFNPRYNFNRSPMALTCDVYGSNGSVSADIQDPNQQNLGNGIQSIVRNFGGTPGGSTVQMQITKTENTAEQDILIAGGGSYGAFSGKGSFTQNKSTYHLYYTIDAVKSLYTIAAMPKSNSFYNQGAAIPSDGFPVMIQDVTFGARVLANMDIAVSSEADAGDVSFNYNDGMESAWAQFKAAVANKNVSITINGYLIGFPAKFGGSFSANPDEFIGMLKTFFNGCDYASAKPIQYAMVNMDGDYMGIESITDKTTVQECTPANENFTLRSAIAVFSTGEDDKNWQSEFWLSIASGDPLHPNWMGTFYDNHTEYKRDGNPYQVTIPVNPNIHETDLDNGGFVALKLIEHNGGNDDWDFQNMDIILNFMSESGTPKTKKLSLGGFKIHDTKNSRYDSKQVLFKSDGKDGYAPEQ